MKLGFFTVALDDKPLPEALDYARSLGCEAVELGAGGYPGNAHCDPRELLADPSALKGFRRTVENSGVEISALSCHGNPLHPKEDIARAHDEDFRNTVQLAAELGVETVIAFAGCPGDSENSERPNWVTCAWPRIFRRSSNGSGVRRSDLTGGRRPYFAAEHGVRVAVEPHPGFVVYNAETFWRLREHAGTTSG